LALFRRLAREQSSTRPFDFGLSCSRRRVALAVPLFEVLSGRARGVAVAYSFYEFNLEITESIACGG
jgi:hypothetical protein